MTSVMRTHDKITPTDQERDDIKALARQMEMDLGPGWPSPREQP